MDKYEFVKDIGAGSFGLARLMRNKATKQLVAMKFIERGCKINKNVEREIINHRSLVHPNIIRFMEVILTSTHLVIVMEYAAGGELFDRIRITGRFSENEARFFFQQLISGLSFCHSRQICHRDLKLANTLLDGSPVPILKICDFGFSKSSMLHSTPKSTVGTPAYIAPEILSRQEYDGKLADVWSIGVTLYIMLVGAYPFEDQAKPKKFKIPEFVYMSQDCRHLLSRMLVASASRRITIEEIKNHPWFLKNLPWEQLVAVQGKHQRNEISAIFSSQSVESIMEIVREARKPAMNHFPVSSSNAESGWANKEISRNFLKKSPWEKPEGAQDIDYWNENPTISPKPLESIMEVVGETKPAMNTLPVFSLVSGFGLAKKAHYDDQKENFELEVEGEGQYDKQVTEVYEDKQMKEVYVYEDKQIMDAYKSTSYRYKMIKLFYKTSLFLTNKFLQIPWYQ